MSHEDDLEEELDKEDDSMIFEDDEDDEDEDEWPTEDETDEDEDDLDLEDDDDRFDWSKDDDEEDEDEDEELETMDSIVGKTVATVAYSDPWDLGLTITFTDGTVLNVRERKQAGEIEVDIDGRTVPFENE